MIWWRHGIRVAVSQFLICAVLFCTVSGMMGRSALAANTNISDTESLFAAHQQSVIQVRLLDTLSKSKSSIGSAFVVDASGLVVTNFHVIAEWIYKPERHAIKYWINDRAQGDLELVGIDVVHDLALLKARDLNKPALHISTRSLRQGETLFSFGNPHDIGLSIVEGTFNGFLEKSLYKKIHFTGAVNAGMSGGPVLDVQGNVVGVNVSAAGNQLSFLVPAEYVRSMIERFENTPAAQDFLAVMRSQLLENQKSYMQALTKQALHAMNMADYQLPGKLGPFMKCWGGTEKRERILFEQTYQICRTEDEIYLSPLQRTGLLEYQHDLYRSRGLGKHRFFSLMQNRIQTPRLSYAADEEMVSEFTCHSDLVSKAATDTLTPTQSRVVFCTREYKKLDGIYDAWLTAVVMADEDEVLQSTFYLSGVSLENAMAFAKNYMERVQWTP